MMNGFNSDTIHRAMNIFYLDHDITKSTAYLVDKHVVKMPLETTQILSTARHINGMQSPYKPTHINHPCVKWAAKSQANYRWLHSYADKLFAEYTFRYGKQHGSQKYLEDLTNCDNLPLDTFVIPPQCMPDEFKADDTVEAYRNYYRLGKQHIHSWKLRPKPEWI